MKKLLIALMMIAGVAQAEQCIINPTSSVYHVDTYIRTQTRCVTTRPANASFQTALAITGALAFLGDVMQNSRFKEAVAPIIALGDYKVYQNADKLPLGGKITVVAGSGQIVVLSDTSHLGFGGGVMVEIYTESSPGIASHKNFLGKGVYIDLATPVIDTDPAIGSRVSLKLKMVAQG